MADDLSRFRHSHDFTPDRGAAEANTRRVIVLTAAIVSPHPKPSSHYRDLLKQHEELRHLTVEVQPLP